MKIHKFNGYAVTTGDSSDGAYHAAMESLREVGVRHLHEWDSDVTTIEGAERLKDPNCDLAFCENYFLKERTAGMEKREVKPGQKYRHFKEGKIVEVVRVAQESESPGSFVVVYDMPETGESYSRPYDMFISEVDRDKYPDAEQKYRFELVEE